MRLSMSSFVKSHKLIWPGVEVPEVQTGIRGPKAATTQVPFHVSTVPTSLLVSITHCMISQSTRKEGDRAFALQALQEFLRRVVSLVGCHTFQFRRLGDDCQTGFSCDAELRVPSHVLWTEAYFNRHIADTWATYISKPWMSSENPLSFGTTLVAFLGFACDPKLPKRLQQALTPRALTLLGYVAELLETRCARSVAVNDEGIHLRTGKRQTLSESYLARQKCALLLWKPHDGDDTQASL